MTAARLSRTKIHYGAPANGVWTPMCPAKPRGRGANVTPLTDQVTCETCKRMMRKMS